jgi:hypothetical protein
MDVTSFKQQQQRFIASDKELFAFYKHLQCRFLNVLLAGKIVSSGLVTRSESKLERGVNMAKEMTGLIPVFGPIVRATVSVGSTAINSTHGARESQRLHRLGHFTTSVAHVETIAEEIARLITLRYRHQIEQLSTTRRKEGALNSLAAKADFIDYFEPGGAEVLADSAVRRMFEYIADGHVDSDGDLTTQLSNAIFSSSGLIPNFIKQKIETQQDYETKERLKEENKENKENKEKKEQEIFVGMKWTDEGIFTRSGIVTPDGKLWRGINSTEAIKRKLQDVSEYMNNSVAWVKTGSEQALKRMANMSGTQLKKLTEGKESVTVVVDQPEEQLPTVEVASASTTQATTITSSITDFFSRTVNSVNATVTMVADKLTSVGDSTQQQDQEEQDQQKEEQNQEAILLKEGSTSGVGVITLSRCDQIEKYGYRLGTMQEVYEYNLEEVPQTEEEIEVTRIKYYVDPPVMYDYITESFLGMNESNVDVGHLSKLVAEMYQLLDKQRIESDKQRMEIDELRSQLNNQSK